MLSPLQKTSAEFAPGIPSRKELGDLSQLSAGDLVDLYTQWHDAKRARVHTDLRLGTPTTKLFSWALRKGLPEPGKKHYAARQPLHEHGYGRFSGILPKGYGQGIVISKIRGKALITNVDENGITFVTAHGKYPERFRLQRMGADRDWLLINVTPTKKLEYEKEHYKVVPKEDVAKVFTPENYIQAKIDGNSTIYKILQDKIEALSFRTSKKTGYPIVHTERAGLYKERLPEKTTQATVLRGEMYGTKGNNKVIPAAELGGILNASVANAILKKEEEGIDIKHHLFDIYKHKGKDIRQKPYSERQKLLKEIVTNLPPAFEMAKSETDPVKQRALWEQIKAGKHPLTTEGIVAHPEKGPPVKVKFTQEGKVIVVKPFLGEGKYRMMAGGLYYALPDKPDKIIGKVGSGFSDVDRMNIIQHPEDWIGRTIRISAQEQFPSGAYRAPAFIARHEDYPEK